MNPFVRKPESQGLAMVKLRGGGHAYVRDGGELFYCAPDGLTCGKCRVVNNADNTRCVNCDSGLPESRR